MSLAVLSPREASIFACIADTVAAPESVLPPVADTDAVAFLDRWLQRSPALNRLGLRALLYAAELAPRAFGERRRLRRLDGRGRARALEAMEAARSRRLRQVVKLMKSMAFLSYYGDDAVMSAVGYDAEANLNRGRRLRAEQGRP